MQNIAHFYELWYVHYPTVANLPPYANEVDQIPDLKTPYHTPYHRPPYHHPRGTECLGQKLKALLPRKGLQLQGC